jgi:BTB/POZ domain-containing protein 1/2
MSINYCFVKEQNIPNLFCILFTDTLCAVLERDTLSIRESRLFGAVVRWAEAECQRQQLPVTFANKQKVLGKALSLIRFPLMTIEEFAAGEAATALSV